MGICDFYPLVQSDPFDLAPTAEARMDLTIQKKRPQAFTRLDGMVGTCGCEPIDKATVKVLDVCYNPIAHTLSDAHGRYCFNRILEPGEYKILAAADGFLTTQTIDIILKKDMPKTVDIHLIPDPLASSGIVYGVIADAASGEPVNGAKIVLVNMDEKAVAKTVSNAQGQYLICAISPGEYSIAVYREGYYKNTMLVMVTENINMKADIQLTSDPETVNGTVSGIVRQYHSLCNINSGTYVGLYKLEDETETLIQAKRTNGEGAYLFTNVPPGQYLVKGNAASEECTNGRRWYLAERAVIGKT